MSAEHTLLFFDPAGTPPPDLLVAFAARGGLDIVPVGDRTEVLDRVGRAFPACVVLSALRDPESALELCATLKGDPFTAITPLAVMVGTDLPELPSRVLEAGADEVLHESASERERALRMDLLLRRAARDMAVHPTTRLPGAGQTERDLARRLDEGARFALCYADLDHFKEFNDRYGYNRGDRVILLVSMILRDLVRGLAPGGFVGHIGGDDFLFTVPLDYAERVCDEVLRLFDELTPYQYSEEDRRAGYFLGKDRRGNVHRVPLMTLSIGVVTNEVQDFTHTAQVSERVAEMKTYAKTLPGSVYVVDRRRMRGSAEEQGDQ